MTRPSRTASSWSVGAAGSSPTRPPRRYGWSGGRRSGTASPPACGRAARRRRSSPRYSTACSRAFPRSVRPAYAPRWRWTRRSGEVRTLAQSLEELVRQSGDLLKEGDWNDFLAVVGAIVVVTATVHVDPGESLPEAVAKLPAEGGEMALRAGAQELAEPLLISDRARIALIGAGPSTVVRCATSEAAIVLDGCRE